MWEKLAGLFRLLWDSGKTLDSHGEAIQRSEDNDTKILRLIQLILNQNQELKRELQHERELRVKELENLELRLRLEISEALRQLPPKE